jgi:hypothetical protein
MSVVQKNLDQLLKSHVKCKINEEEGFYLMQEHKLTQMRATKNDPCCNQQLIDQFFGSHEV